VLALKVAHVTTACRWHAPGIDAAVTGIAAATARAPDMAVSVLGIVLNRTEWPSGKHGGIERQRIEIVGPRTLAYAPGLAAALSHLRPHVVHQHGAWQYPGGAASRWCRGEGVPFVLSPHGMFSAVGLAARRARKLAAWLAWQRTVATTAHLIHATSEQELHAIRRLGLRSPVAVIPLGVTVPEHCPRKPEGSGLRAVYLGRLDPLKGVGDLVAAWASLRPRGWSLTIAGPDHRGYLARLQRSIAHHGLADEVAVIGPVWRRDRDALLETADLLVLPSYTENFGLVVAEALARAVPVVATTGTPWQCLVEEGCGWVAPCGVGGITAALSAACGLDLPTLRLMGRRGWALARARFDWDEIGRQFAAAYRWLCTSNAMPSCIRLTEDQ
jgi:glycosyltransferase involved in cell wall biosynthesis